MLATNRLAAKLAPGDSTNACPRTPARKWKYAFFKENLDASISNLEAWQRIFDPSWYLILKATENKMTSSKLDQELAKQLETPSSDVLSSTQVLRFALTSTPNTRASIFLRESGLDPALAMAIPFSTAKTGQRYIDSQRASQCYILESFACPLNMNPAVLTRDVRNFAMKLAHAEPDAFGLLRCKGVIPHCATDSRIPSHFTFVFWVPTGMSRPISLRSKLMDGDEDHSLSERFRLASELAKSISFIHIYNFVHKNIRPETVLLFQDGVSSLGSAFLVGFENVRTAEGMTFRAGDLSWHRDIYRHPRRQGQAPEQDYIMQHDIYSLGVCLLEIGLWQSFVVIDDTGDYVPSPALNLPQSGDDMQLLPFQKDGLKDHLVSLARSELPRRMGTRYTQIVDTCLTCLDPGNVDFGDEKEFEDEDGIVIGVRFIQKVRLPLIYATWDDR